MQRVWNVSIGGNGRSVRLLAARLDLVELHAVAELVPLQIEHFRGARLIPVGTEFCVIKNPEWRKQNGISLLAAKDHIAAPFLLAMSDHLFDDAIVDLLIESADLSCLNLAMDRKLNSIFDLDDAMKVQTRGNRVAAIGKNLRAYDAIDTGLFICPFEILEYLERAK